MVYIDVFVCVCVSVCHTHMSFRIHMESVFSERS